MVNMVSTFRSYDVQIYRANMIRKNVGKAILFVMAPSDSPRFLFVLFFRPNKKNVCLG